MECQPGVALLERNQDLWGASGLLMVIKLRVLSHTILSALQPVDQIWMSFDTRHPPRFSHSLFRSRAVWLVLKVRRHTLLLWWCLASDVR
jgi:hypothetical protein